MSDQDNLFSVLGTLKSTDATIEDMARERAITDNILENQKGRARLDEEELSGLNWYDQELGHYRDDPTNTDRVDAREAQWDLGAADTVRGLSGAYNRKSFLDKSQSMLTLARSIQGVDNSATLDALHSSAFNEFSESGWTQASRGVAGVLTLGQLGMTTDTKDFMANAKEAIAASAPPDLAGANFTAERFVEAVRAGNEGTALAMDEFNINAESLAGVQNYEDAVQALSMQLWSAGREKRAGQQQLTSIESGMNFFSNLGDMILQDPDFAAEIGLEAAGIIGVSVLTGGAGGAAWLAASYARKAHKIGKFGRRISQARAAQGLATRTRWANRLDNAADLANKLNTYKPGLSTGGNIFEAVARSGKLNSWASQNGAFLLGQMVDGFVGGAGARYRTNVFLNEEAMALYGNQAELVPNTDRMMIDGAMGAMFSSVLGFGFRFGGRKFMNQFRSEARQIGFDDFATDNINRAKTEKQKLEFLYGEDPPTGVKASQAIRDMENQAVLHMTFARGRDITKTELKDLRALIGNLNEGIPTHLFTNALGRVAQDVDTGDGTPLSTEAIAYRILHDSDFVEGLENHARYTPEKAAYQLRSQKAHLAHMLNMKGVDPELDAARAKAKAEGKDPAEALAELRAQRLEEVEAKKAELEKKKAAAEADKAEGTRKAAEAEQKRINEEAEAAKAEAERLRAEAEAAKKAREEADAEAMGRGESPDKSTKELEDRKKVLEKVKEDNKASDDKVASLEDLDKIDKEIEAIDKDLESRSSTEESELPADRADEAEAAAAAAEANAEAAVQRQQEFDFDTAVRESEAVSDAGQTVIDREIEALDRRKEAIEKGENGGAGGMDDTGLTSILNSKARDAEIKNERLDRLEDYLTGPDAPEVRGSDIKAKIDPDYDGDPNAVIGPQKLKKIIADQKKKNIEESKIVTDQDLHTFERLEVEGLTAQAEVAQQAKLVESKALHKAWLAGGRGAFHGDPAQFRAAAIRSADEAERLTIEARKNADWRNDPEVKGILEERKALMEELAELRKIDADVRDTPALLKEDAEVEISKAEMDEAIAATRSAVSKLGNKDKLKAKAKELGLTNYSRLNRDPLIDLITDALVKRGLDDLKAKKRAQLELTGTRKGAEIDEAQAKLDEMNSTLAKKGYYDRDTDYRSLELAEAGVTALMRKPSLGSKQGDIGTITFDSLAAVFNDTPSLKDIDIETVFAEALTEGSTPSKMRFNVDKVANIIAQRKDAAVPMARRSDDLLTPQQLRLRQAQEIADWRADNAGKKAEASETGWSGARDGDDWEAQFYRNVKDILGKHSNNTGTRASWKKKSIADIKKMVDEDMMPYTGMGSIRDLGDGTADFVHPLTAAKAMVDVMWNRPDGRKAHSIDIEEVNPVTGAVEVKSTRTDLLAHTSRVQPATDREIARILDKMEYDARMEAIARLDFEGPGQPTLDQVVSFIADGNLRQDTNRALNREEFQTRAFWVPPELRTNIDRAGETIEQRIDRVTDELLEKDFTAYDILHDDFKTRAGDWGVAMDEVDMNFFRNHGVAGGFPVASAMPGDDGYSFGMAVLDAHMLLHPQTWLDTVSAQQRGADLKAERDALEAKAKDGTLTTKEKERLGSLRSGDSVTSIDGAQNGVRHAHALSMIDSADDIDNIAAAVAAAKASGTGKQRDFYKDLAMVTSKFLASSDDPLAKVWSTLELVGAGKVMDNYDEVTSAARKFAKKPVMVIPYGAGKRAISNSIRDGIKGLDPETRVAFEAAAAEAGGVEKAIDFLATRWYGDQQKQTAGLIEEALDLPSAAELVTALMKDKSKKDPLENLFKTDDPREQLQLQIERAQEIAERTGIDEDVAMRSVMIQARALAITRADDIPAEAAALLARRQMAKEMNMVQQAIELEKAGDANAWADVIAAGEKGEMGFTELTLMAMQRSEFVQSDSAQARATARQTGQEGARFQLPDEAEGSMFFQQLMDWRTRMVTPRAQEANLKGRKSERSAMDLHQIMEESESLVFRSDADNAAELAEADLHRVDDGSMTPDEWFDKHINGSKTIASGVIGLRGIEMTDRPMYSIDKSGKRRRMTKRIQLEEKAYNLTGDELTAELKRMKIEDTGLSASAKKKALYEAYIEQEKLRIKKLAVKSALAEAAPEFAPPIRLDENGNVAQMGRLSQADKMDRWEAHSEDIRNSSDRAFAHFNSLDEEGKAAYKKAYGLPHRSMLMEDGSFRESNQIVPFDSTPGTKEVSFTSLQKAGKVGPSTAKTMGGMLGSRPIHPTEATDMSLGVPALRVLAQNKSMGQRNVSGKMQRIQIDGEARGVAATRRIQDGGDIFDVNERHRVNQFDNDDLPVVDRSEVLHDPDLVGRMSDEARDAMIEESLTRHAAQYGLDDLVAAGKWGEIYAHQVWRKNIKRYSDSIASVENMKPGKDETVADFQARKAEARKQLASKWDKITEETRQQFEDSVNGEWDSKSLDPFNNIHIVDASKTTEGTGKPMTRREAIQYSARLNRDGSLRSDRKASQKTNVDLIAGESIDGMRHAGSEMPDAIVATETAGAGGALPIRSRQTNKVLVDEKTGEMRVNEGFSRSNTADFGSGETVDFADVSENAIIKVHFTHASDRGGALTSVGLREDISLLEGLGFTHGQEISMKDARKLLEDSYDDSSLLGGYQGTVRFFTMDGIEVIDGHMAGHNVRRNATRNEAHWILQNSTNRFLGDRLSVSALTRQPVHRQRSSWAMMDDRLRNNKEQATQIANENQQMLNWLKDKDPEAIQTSSFLGNVMDLEKYWSREGFRERMYASEYDRVLGDARKSLGIEKIEEVTNPLYGPERTNLQNLLQANPDRPIPVRDTLGDDGKVVSYGIKSVTKEGFRTRVTDPDFGPKKVRFSPQRGKDSSITQSYLKELGFPSELTPDQVRTLIGRFKAEEAGVFDPRIDPIDAALKSKEVGEGGSAFTPQEATLARQLAGLAMISGKEDIAYTPEMLGQMFPLLAGDTVPVGVKLGNVIAMAERGIAHARKTRKLVQLATRDGITGYGRIPHILRLASDGEIDLNNITSKDLARLNQSWKDHEVGGFDRGTDNLDEGQLNVMRAEVQRAKDILDSVEKDPFSGVSVSTYKGDFVDQNGVKRSPAYFMESSNFEMLSPAHQRFNGFLENLLESGTLDLTQVRMLRAATAQLDKSILEGLSLKELTDPEFRAHAKELGLGSAKKARARGLSYSKGGYGIALLKGRVGRDIDAVDVVLHEIGHTAMARMIREGGPEMDEIRGLAASEEGRTAMKEMVKQMHGGKFTQEAQKQYAYFTKDPDEFVAAWFSYTMMARSLDDTATIAAAYQKSGNWGQALSNIVRKIAAYAYKRISGFSRIMSDLDPTYRAKMNSLMDHLSGKTYMAPVDQPRNMAAFHGEAEDMAGSIRDHEAEIEALRLEGIAEDDPMMIAAKKDLQDAIDAALENTKPAHLNGDGSGPTTMREFLDRHFEEEYTDADGVIDFGRMVENDPIAAENFIAMHLLPKLQEGRYADVPNVGRDMAANRELTSSQRVSARTKIDNFILSPSNAAHTVNSTVQLQVGDTRYSLMQLLSEVIDNHSMMTQGRLNGNQFSTLSSVARALESELVRPFSILDDELRLVIAKVDGHKRGRLRTLASTDGELQAKLKNYRELAGRLNLPKDSAMYKAAVEEHARLAPEIAEVVTKLQKQFAKGSGLVKANAQRANILGGDRAAASGLMPLRLRTENMTDKARPGGFGERLTRAYESKMLASDVLDLDTLIGVGLLPVPSKVLDRQDLHRHLRNLARDGMLDPDQVEAFSGSPRMDDLVKSIRAGKAAEVDDLRGMLTDRGRAAYDAGVKDGQWTGDGAIFINSRYEAEIAKSGSTDKKVYYRNSDSGAELRQLRLGRRTGSTSYYFGGDAYLSLTNVLDDMGDLFDMDVRIGASALQRGIGLQSMDAANMSRGMEGTNVRGLSIKSLLDLAEKMSQRSTDSHTKTSMEQGIRHLRAAYERLGGGLPTVERTGKVIEDGIARNAANVAMLQYGGNLGVAMFAETAVTALTDIAPRAIKDPVKTMVMSWKALTDSLSPIRKTQVARQLLFGMHIAKDTVSIRSLDRTTDDLAAPDPADGFLTKSLRTLGGLTSKFSGAHTVQTFNKSFAAAGAMDDLLSHMDSAVELRRLLDEAGGVADEKQFKELAKKAGFGRNWTLALAMQDHGLLDATSIGALRNFAESSGADTSRIIDLDAWSDGNAKLAAGKSDASAADRSLQGVRAFIEDRIARNNVEPRVLDQRLTNNNGWNKIQEVFLSWPRAFYAQKSFVRGGNAFKGGAGHLAAFYAGQAVWDAMYTTIQELARGEDPDKIMAEVTADPVGWTMKKASRTPILGAWSQGVEMLVDQARNKAAQGGIDGFGYHTRSQGGIDFGSSPVIAAMNQIGTTVLSSAEFLWGASVGGTNSFSAKDPKALEVFNGWLDLLPIANSLPAKTMREMFSQKDEFGRNRVRRGQFYYDMLQMKRDYSYRRKQIMNQYRY